MLYVRTPKQQVTARDSQTTRDSHRQPQINHKQPRTITNNHEAPPLAPVSSSSPGAARTTAVSQAGLNAVTRNGGTSDTRESD